MMLLKKNLRLIAIVFISVYLNTSCANFDITAERHYWSTELKDARLWVEGLEVGDALETIDISDMPMPDDMIPEEFNFLIDLLGMDFIQDLILANTEFPEKTDPLNADFVNELHVDRDQEVASTDFTLRFSLGEEMNRFKIATSSFYAAYEGKGEVMGGMTVKVNVDEILGGFDLLEPIYYSGKMPVEAMGSSAVEAEGFAFGYNLLEEEFDELTLGLDIIHARVEGTATLLDLMPGRTEKRQRKGYIPCLWVSGSVDLLKGLALRGSVSTTCLSVKTKHPEYIWTEGFIFKSVLGVDIKLHRICTLSAGYRYLDFDYRDPTLRFYYEVEGFFWSVIARF